MSTTLDDLDALLLSDPVRPFPFSHLARQLEDLFLGISTTTIFCFDGALPGRYDPTDPPEGIVSHSRQAFLLHRFFQIRTKRFCTVNEINPETGFKKRCDNSSYGFEEILKHQREAHKRTCQFVCIIEDCMALFDKVGNAKRHAEKIHTFAALRKKEVMELTRNHSVERYLRAAAKLAENRGVRRDAELKRKVARVRSAAREKQAAESAPMRAITATQRSRNIDMFLHLRIKPAVLDVRSVIKKDTKEDKMRMAIIPTSLTGIDVADFHKRNIRRGQFHGDCKNIEQAEWVAVTGLMELYYGPGVVKYRFLKRLNRVKGRYRQFAPALAAKANSAC